MENQFKEQKPKTLRSHGVQTKEKFLQLNELTTEKTIECE
jgi:hypothetical protein